MSNDKSDKFESKSLADESFKSALQALKPVANFAGRVTGLKKQDPVSTNFYFEGQKKLRNKYLKLAEKREGINQSVLEMLNNIDDYLINGLITYPQYYALVSQAINTMESIDKSSAEVTQEVNQKFNNQSEKIESQSQDIINEEDPFLKKRLLLIFLIAAPFFPIPYLDFLVDPLSQIFDPTQTIGESMSEMVKSESLGEFGKLMDKAQVDELMRLIFDETPVFGELFGAIDQIAGSNLVYGSAQMLSPMLLESPLLYLAISAGSSVYLTEKELEIQKKIRNITNSSNKSIEKLKNELEKKYEEKFGEKAKQHGEDMYKAWQRAGMVEELDRLKVIMPKPCSEEFKKLYKNIGNFDEIKSFKHDDFYPALFSLSDENLKKILDKTLIFHQIKSNKMLMKIKDKFDKDLYNGLEKSKKNFQDFFSFDVNDRNAYDFKLNLFKKFLEQGNPLFVGLSQEFSKESELQAINKINESSEEALKEIFKDLEKEFIQSFHEKTLEHLIEVKNLDIDLLRDKSLREQSFFGSKDTFSTQYEIKRHQKDIDDINDILLDPDSIRPDYVRSLYEGYTRDKILKNAAHCRVLGDIVPSRNQIMKGKGLSLKNQVEHNKIKIESEKKELENRVPWAKRVSPKGSGMFPRGIPSGLS